MDATDASPSRLSVRELGDADLDEAAGVLARSFAQETIFSYLLGGDEQTRTRLLVGLMRGMIKAHAPSSAVDGVFVNGRMAGVSLAVRPGRFPFGLKDMSWVVLSSLFPVLWLAIRKPRILKLFMAAATFSKHHPKRRDYWYLAFLGVDPKARTGGVARELARVVLDRADGAGAGILLDTAGKKTMRMCRFLGFEVRHEFDLFKDGPSGYSMWRPPPKRSEAS